MKLPKLAADFAHGFPAFGRAVEQLKAEWAPDDPPVTFSMSKLGHWLVRRADEGFSREDIAEIFQRVERIFESGTEPEKDAVATGFLEAIAAELDESPQTRWLLDYAGPEARKYLAAWDEFCGISSGE